MGCTVRYESIQASDTQRRAPGAENIAALLKGKPTLILLDELSIYLRKVKGRPEADQLTPFLTDLFKAVEMTKARCDPLAATPCPWPCPPCPCPCPCPPWACKFGAGGAAGSE